MKRIVEKTNKINRKICKGNKVKLVFQENKEKKLLKSIEIQSSPKISGGDFDKFPSAARGLRKMQRQSELRSQSKPGRALLEKEA